MAELIIIGVATGWVLFIIYLFSSPTGKGEKRSCFITIWTFYLFPFLILFFIYQFWKNKKSSLN